MQSLMRLGTEVRAGTESPGRFLRRERSINSRICKKRLKEIQLLYIRMPTKSKIVSDYATFANALTPIVGYKDSKGARW